jgi:hypothetical protein
MKKLISIILVFLVMYGCQIQTSDYPDAPAKIVTPRIVIVNNEFYLNGEKIILRGYNYVRLAFLLNRWWHANFDPGLYNRDRIKAALEKMILSGMNILRVFISYTGIQGDLTEPGIDKAYMDNFIDFLQLARDAKIHVMLTSQYLPRNYRVNWPPEDITPNAMYSGRYLEAMKVYWTEFISYIRDYDSDLLNVIFSYDVQNEMCWEHDKPPFSGLNKQAMDKLMVELGTAWMNQIVDTIKAVDPEALITGSICPAINTQHITAWPLDTVGNSKADFIEMHLYPFNNVRDLNEYMDIYLGGQYDRLNKNKPIIAGEFGMDRQFCPEPKDATAWVNGIMEITTEQYGFQGHLFWTYDCTEQGGGLWTGMEENETVNNAIMEASAAMTHLAISAGLPREIAQRAFNKNHIRTMFMTPNQILNMDEIKRQ